MTAEDLAALLEEQRAAHVAELAPGSVTVSWGAGRRGRRLQSIRMAAYDPRARRIVVHPRLDDHMLPRWVLASVLHHELLHAAMGVSTGAIHTPEFRRRERTHPDYLRARAWERDFLPALLSASW